MHIKNALYKLLVFCRAKQTACSIGNNAANILRTFASHIAHKLVGQLCMCRQADRVRQVLCPPTWFQLCAQWSC